MGKISSPKALSECKIVEELILKAEGKTDISINALNILDEFRKRVSEEVRHINELFPEYTPHDESYHLSRLFHIAVTILGDAIIENLNFSELLILSLSLYGHDWGMAVSEVEKELIIHDTIREGYSRSNYALLPDEHNKFLSFLTEKNLKKADPVELSTWQEYVRQTHALRSGERVRKYFDKMHPGLGEACSRVCEAHWLDFKYLEDNITYPLNFAIFNENANLKSLSVYLRLIDLLDISQERTPYVIWKYVAPENSRSKMEWDKHRSIHSISSSPYQDGRIIQIEGATKDNAVYASLMDLKSYCNEQLKGCNDLLHRINNSRHNLNIFEINWRIRAIGFKPISIQFEFDRGRMFEILSDEIYQGDKYVFIRELLQNSIDAIKLRKEIVEKRGGVRTALSDFGIIEIDVKHLKDGDAEITISDNGVGMDEYIIKNYLSIAGKSYYVSEDFKNLGLSMDPISRFGIGVLSCFMVADSIDIETYREPYLSSSPEKLKIKIPSVAQQFRIESINDPTARPGSLFRIYVSGKKLKNGSGPSVDKLNVTEYISRIAGFVDIPIIIEEDGKKTMITGPYNDSEQFKGSGVEIRTIQLHYPWEKAFEPLSFEVAKKHFKEKSIDLTKDLKLEGVQGKIILLEPIDPRTVLSWEGLRYHRDTTVNGDELRIRESWYNYQYRSEYNIDEFGKSASCQPQYQVYMDGILLANVSPPDKFNYSNTVFDRYDDEIPAHEYFENNYASEKLFCLPYLVVNFQKSAIIKIDMARSRLLEGNTDWDKLIWERYASFLRPEFENILLQKPKNRAFSLAQSLTFKKISFQNVKGLIPIEKVVVPVVTHKSKLMFKEWETFLNKPVFLQPEEFYWADKLLAKEFKHAMAEPGKGLENWKGSEYIITDSDQLPSCQTVLISRIVWDVIESTHRFTSLRFLHSPVIDGCPLTQKIYEPCPVDQSYRKVSIDEIIDNICDLTHEQLASINKIPQEKLSEKIRLGIEGFCKFQHPFQDHFSAGYKYLNIDHPITKLLILAYCIILKYNKKEDLKKTRIGALINAAEDAPFLAYRLMNGLKETNEKLKRIYGLLSTFPELKGKDPILFTEITMDSFIPNSVVKTKDGIFSTKHSKVQNKPRNLSAFGKPLTL